MSTSVATVFNRTMVKDGFDRLPVGTFHNWLKKNIALMLEFAPQCQITVTGVKISKRKRNDATGLSTDWFKVDMPQR